MFKKIEIWILYLFILISILATLFFGVLVRQGIEGRTSFGTLSIKFLTDPIVFISRIPEQLVIGAFKSNQNRINDPWDEQRPFWSISGFKGENLDNEAYLLLSRYDGDLEESVVEIIDLRSFKTLHTWNPDIDQINSLVDKKNPEFKDLPRDKNNFIYLILHPFLTDNGELIFQSTSPLIKIDSCSNLVWQNQVERFHHSLEIDFEGNFWIPSHIYPYSINEKIVGTDEDNYLDDGITKISPNGEIIYKKSVSDIFMENNLDYLLYSVGDMKFDLDPIHLNDIQPALEDGPYWKQGDIFLSLRNQSMIILFRPTTNKILWIGTGYFYHQHDIDILDDHRISIFNNNSKDFFDGDQVDGFNEVLIYDFNSKKYNKYLNSSLIENEVRTIKNGRSQILPNNDLMIEEYEAGRILYFNADGSLRWQYINSSSINNIYTIGWSRIMYSTSDIDKVSTLLQTASCNYE